MSVWTNDIRKNKNKNKKKGRRSRGVGLLSPTDWRGNRDELAGENFLISIFFNSSAFSLVSLILAGLLVSLNQSYITGS